MSSSAQKRGLNLLEKFSSAKRAEGSSNPSSASKHAPSDDDSSSYDPNTEGSFLRGLQYGESKTHTPIATGAKKVSISPSAVPNTAGSIAEDDENSPLEMLRFAMLQLNSTGADEQAVDSIASMLQGVEEYLEHASARRAQSKQRAAARVSELGSTLTQTPNLQTPGGEAMHRSQRSILLENQLDLNESEMEYYEQIINDLAAKLEKLTEERDDLTDKVERLNEEKEELQEISSNLGNRLQLVTEEKVRLEIQFESLESERKEVKERAEQLEGKLKDAMSSAGSPRKRSPSAAASSGGNVGAVVEELREINRDLESELEDCHAEIDNMSSLVEDLRLKLDNADGSGDNAAEVEEMKSQLQIKDAALLAMHKQQEVLNNTINDLTSQIDLKNHEISAFQQRLQSSSKNQSTKGKQGDSPHSLTNTFLGISASVDSDEEGESDARPMAAEPNATPQGSSSFVIDSRFNSAQWDSFHSTADHVFKRNDIDELKQVIAERDRQMKVHISQLQAQQDSLTELKNAINMLKQQKSGLRKALNDANSKMDELKQSELRALNRANEIQNQLDNELIKSEELKLSLQDSETRGNELQSLVNDLMKKTASYRKQIDEGGASGHGSTYTTPSKNKNVTIQENALVPASNPSPALNTLQHRLSLAESQVDELTAQLRMSEKQREDIQLEFDKLAVRFQTKARQADEQVMEIQHLRNDLDANIAEVDRLKIKEMKFEANSKLAQIDNESEIEILNGRIHTLEKMINDQKDKLRQKEAEINAEAEASQSLRDVLQKLGERDDATEELLNQLRDERENALSQVEETSSALKAKVAELEQCQIVCDELEQELDSVMQQKAALEGTVKKLQNTVETLQLGNSEDVQEFQNRLVTIEQERSQFEEMLDMQKQLTSKAEHELANKSAELAISKRTLNDVTEMVQYYDARLHNMEETLSGRVAQELASFDVRLDNSAWTLQRATDDFVKRVAESEQGKILAENALRETQSTLKSALYRHEDDSEATARAVQELQELRQIEQELREQLDSANAQLAERIDMSATQENYVQKASDDVLALKKQLAEAETRAEQLSSESAHSYAEQARNIAYLESENARLNDLVKHLRTDGENLAAQLREAQLQGQHTLSLEHRLKRMEEEERALQDRLRANEAVIVKKEKDLLELLNNARDQEEQRNEYFGGELAALSKQLKDSHDKIHALIAEKKAVCDQYEQHDAATKSLIETLEEKLNANERDIKYQQGRVDDLEYELRNAQSALQDKEHQLSQNSTKLLLMQEESSINAETHADAIRELKLELQEKQDTINSLDEQVFELKAKLRSLEEEFLRRDEDIAAKLMKRAAADDENRQLRHLLDTTTYDNGELRRRLDEVESELQNKISDLEAAQNDMNQMKGDLNEAENDLQQLQDDNRDASEQINALQQELDNTKNNLSETREALRQAELKSEQLEEDCASIKAEEMKLRSHNESLAENNSYLRNQLDELMPKLANSSRECSELRSKEGEQADYIKDLELHAEDAEARLKQMRASFEAFDIAESDILNSMREVGEVLSSKTGTDPVLQIPGGTHGEKSMLRTPGPPPASAASVNTSSATEGHFHIGTDLFSSPPLAVTRSPLNLYSDAANNVNIDLTADSIISQSDALATIKQGVALLRMRSANLATAYHTTYEALDQSRREKEETQKELEKMKDKLHMLSFEREKFDAKCRKAEEETGNLKKRLSQIETEKDIWLNSDQSNNQKMKAILRDMDTCLLEAVAAANDAVAGIVPISADSLPNLSISQSLIEKNDGAMIPASADVSGSAPSSGTSAITVLSVTVNEVDRVTEYMNNIVLKLVAEYKSKADALASAEERIENCEAEWNNERDELIASGSQKQEEIDELQGDVARLSAELDSVQNEIERVKAKIPKLQNANAELEAEKKQNADQIHNLRMELQSSENMVLDLRSKNRLLNADIEKRGVEFSTLNEQLLDSRRRITDRELEQEKHNAQLVRMKAEKEALDNVRKSLETELERSRAESVTLREQVKLLDEEHRSAFEVEKLLAALGNTLDQVMPHQQTTSTSSNNNSGINNNSFEQSQQLQVTNTTSFHAAGHSTLSADFTQETIPSRVDTAVRRLTQLRSWARDEARRRRALDGELSNIKDELQIAQTSVSESREQLKQAMQNVTERESELRDKSKEIDELQYELQKLRNELNRVKLDQSTSAGMLDDERRSTDSLRDELRSKEGQMARLQSDLDNRNSTVAKLQDQLNHTNAQLTEATTDANRRAEQLRTAKANNDRLMSTMEQMERGIEEDRRERENAERRILEVESQADTFARTKARVGELERQLAKSRDEQRQLAHEKAIVEEKQLTAMKELDASRKKLNSLENRINAVMNEKNTFVDEVAETRRKIALAKEFAEQERKKRMQSDAAIEALKRSGEEQRVDLVGFASQSEDLEALHSRAEEEKRSLRTKISELKLLCDEKDTQRIADASDRKKLEKDVKQLKATLAKRNAELESSSNYSSLLRSEGRHARQQVMQAVGSIRELMKIVRLDAQAAGVELLSPDAKKTSSESHVEDIPNKSGISYDDALSLGLVEALGINDLAHALSILREGMAYLTTAPENRMNMVERIKDLEAERKDLLKELQGSESQRTDLVSRYKEEINSMHQHITELRRTDSKNPHLTHQISVLEAALQHEKEKSRKANSDVASLKTRIDQLTREMTAPHQRSADGVMQVEVSALRKELDKQKAENAELSQEVTAINYHRTVLRDTIEQLERQVKDQCDKLGQLHAQVEHANADFPVSAMGTLLDVSSPIGSPMTSAISSPVRGATNPTRLDLDARRGGEISSKVKGAETVALSEDDEDALKRQVMRYKVRAAAMEELATTYRTSVLALYADGASYGAAQYGWQPQGIPQEFASKGLHLIGVGWIEREMNAVKHSYEDEIRVLDAEVAELRAKLKYRNSYIIELRKGFEENLKGIFRASSGNKVTESYVEQFEQLRQALENAHAESSSLQQELLQDRAESKVRHQQLVERLTKSLQSRDAALGALKRLEQYCGDHGLDIHGLAIYETLKSEMSASNDGTQQVKRVYSNNSLNTSGHGLKTRSHDSNENLTSLSSVYQHAQQSMLQQQQQQQAIAQLMRGLVEADHDLAEAERRREGRGTATHRSQSAGRSRSATREPSSGQSSRSNSNTRAPPASSNGSQPRGSNLPRPSHVQRSAAATRMDAPVEERLTKNFLASHQPQSASKDASYQLPNVGKGGGSGSLRVSSRRK